MVLLHMCPVEKMMMKMKSLWKLLRGKFCGAEHLYN